ncbi:MAG: hypothetical protein RR554_11680 [Vagococcus sp.]|uniref:hypothetical protein n=1 Tax=Vagococcus sp. TaxID=1933889 RepID=UPI002FC795EE
MYQQLKNNFTHATLGTFIWIIFLSSFIFSSQNIPFNFIWHLLAISILFGVVFGVFYPFLWKYATFKAFTNILLSTLVNFLSGILSVYLFSPMMFTLITPYFLIFAMLTFLGHVIAFYIYSHFQSKKQAQEFNQYLL